MASAGEVHFNLIGVLFMAAASCSDAMRLVVAQKLLRNQKMGTRPDRGGMGAHHEPPRMRRDEPPRMRRDEPPRLRLAMLRLAAACAAVGRMACA